MRYRDLLLLSALWGVCAVSLEGRDVLACPFEPQDRTAEEFAHDKKAQAIFKIRPLSPQEIRKKAVKAVNWETVHPTIKDWINKNQDKYYERVKNYVLYNDEHNGIRISLYPDLKGDKIFLNRTHWFNDDAAWEYEKEQAINPATKKPWIELTSAELKSCTRGGKKLNDSDQQFLKDVLSVVNENFHYFYGMKFVCLEKNPNLNKEQLVGKFIPTKAYLFDEHVDMLNLSDYSEQKQEIYKTLGHPIYSYDGLVDSTPAILASSNCGGNGFCYFYFKSGLRVSVVYFNQADVNAIDPRLAARAAQVGATDEMFNKMMERLEKLCEEKGANVSSSSANKTPLAKALYLVYQKTKKMTNAVATHEYVPGSYNMDEFEPGIERLSDVVKIPGVKTIQSKTKNSSGTKGAKTSKKTKVSSSKKQRRQSTERTRS